MNSPLWLQMAADIFGKVLKTTGAKDASTVGAAIIGLQALGDKSLSERWRPEIAAGTPELSQDSGIHQQRFQRYLELYEHSSAK